MTDLQSQLQRKLNNSKVECRVCPRFCQLNEGQRGFCYVRQNKNGKIVLTAYGKSSGFCIDPIEKKPLYHFYPGSAVLSFGTAGCNLGCKFCQNWSISKSKEIETLSEEALPNQIALTAKQYGCKSVAFTYNDPTIFLEYAIDTAKECKKLGIKTVAVTAGFITKEAAQALYPYIDAFNVDLKAFTNTFYKQLCFASLDPVLKTLKFIREQTNAWLEITNLIIPTRNSNPEEIKELSMWIKNNLGDNIPLHFTAFHPAFKMLDIPPTPPAMLKQARKIAINCGLKYVYTGNIIDAEGNNTFCPQCKQCLIKRNYYNIEKYNLTDKGHCPKCNYQLDGKFENKITEQWGNKRKAIYFN